MTFQVGIIPNAPKKGNVSNTICKIMNKITKTCPVCGKEFEPIRKTKKCCSYKCSNIYWRKSVGLTKEKVIKTCPTCGKTFEPSRSDQIYCSKACCNKAYNVPSKKLLKKCVVCGKEFHAGQPFAKYCSDECRKLARQQLLESVTKQTFEVDGFNNFCKSLPKNPLLDKHIKEADACGLSYGQYKAQLRLGKTFEELKAQHDRRIADD